MADTTTPLSPERIAFLMATTKRRGEYEGAINDLVESGELACVVSDLPYFKGKEVNAVRNSFNLNIEKKSKENEWPTLTVALEKEDTDGNKYDTPRVILINLDVLAEMTAAA